MGIVTGTVGADACNSACQTHSWNQTNFTLWTDYLASRLGCTSSLVKTTFGTPTASNEAYKYPASCSWAVGGNAVYGLRAIGGGHTWTAQDSDSGAIPLSPRPEVVKMTRARRRHVQD